MSTFSATRFLQQAKTYSATHASLFAAPIRMILARGNTPVPGLALKHCWYAMNIAEHQYAELAELLSCQPRQLYGMTETIPAVLTDEAAAPRPDCMGYVSPGCVLDVQDAEGHPVAVGEIGEIVVSDAVDHLPLTVGTLARERVNKTFGDTVSVAVGGHSHADVAPWLGSVPPVVHVVASSVCS